MCEELQELSCEAGGRRLRTRALSRETLEPRAVGVGEDFVRSAGGSGQAPPRLARCALTVDHPRTFFFDIGKPATEYISFFFSFSATSIQILFTKYITARYYDFGRLGERKRLQTRVDYHTIPHLEY